MTTSELRAKLSAIAAQFPKTPSAKSLVSMRASISHVMRDLLEAQTYWIMAMSQKPQPCYYPSTTLQLAGAVIADIYQLIERLAKEHFPQNWKSSTEAMYTFLETGTSLMRLDRANLLFRLPLEECEVARKASELLEAHAKLVHETVVDCLAPILNNEALRHHFNGCIDFISPKARVTDSLASATPAALATPTTTLVASLITNQKPQQEANPAVDHTTQHQRQKDGLSVYRMLYSDIYAIRALLEAPFEEALNNFKLRIPELQRHLIETAQAIGTLDYPQGASSANTQLPESCILALGTLYKAHQVSAFPLLFAEQLADATRLLVHAPGSDVEFCFSETLLDYLDVDAILIQAVQALKPQQQEAQIVEQQPAEPLPAVLQAEAVEPVSQPDLQPEISLRHYKTRHILALMHEYHFTETRQTGSHKIFRHEETGGQVVVPDHPSLPRGTVKSIEEQVRAALSKKR